MFQVLVVDDEPGSVEYICNIIKLKCPGMMVAGTAENGLEGLEQFRRLKPDLVVSDVKMPVMDGIVMVRAIKEECPSAQILLVSGYQEFEYVRAALKYGVLEYIVKPMTPAGFVAAVSPIIKELNKRTYEQRKKLVRSMVTGELTDEKEVRTYFQEDRYYVAVIRENGLARRFTGAYEMELISEQEDTIFVYGRDEREALYICPSKALRSEAFFHLMEKEAKRKKNGSNFVTMAVLSQEVETGKLTNAIERLYRSLNSRLSIGVSQSFFVQEKEKGTGDKEDLHYTDIMKSMEHFLERKEYDMLLNQLWNFINKAGECAYPQLRLERLVRQAAVKIQQHENYHGDVFEDEIMLEDAFYDAGSKEELFDHLKNMFIRYWKEDKEAVKLDSRQFLEMMKTYIDSHLSENMTVSSVCRQFNLSQSYLNMIFRKYGMQSFNIYLRTARIEQAKRIMEQNPSMYMKDVAIMVGYKDQFYFSRIFRAVTGTAPSEYN